MSGRLNNLDDKDLIGMSDDLRSTDRAILTALSHRQSDGTPLSPDQECLLDDWVAGRLSSFDADRADELAKHNVFAAERVLERRLVSAANEGPAVPGALAVRVLRASRPPTSMTRRIFNLRWPILTGWQWSGRGAAAMQWSGLGAAAMATAAIVAIFGFQFWQQQLRPAQSFQIAMVTIEDRSVLAEKVTRGIHLQVQNEGEAERKRKVPSGEEAIKRRFRDIDVPTALLQRAITSASDNKGAAEYPELMNYLHAQGDAFKGQTRILIDSALADKLSRNIDEHGSIRVRVFDLADSRAANILGEIKPAQVDSHLVLLTVR
jgi:hypothetical protein